MARSTDTFQNTGDRSHGQTRAGTTLGFREEEFKGEKKTREREVETEKESEDHRLSRLTVCMSVGLSNYRLAWCVEPKVYHNTAQVMTPYTTHTCRRKYTHTHTTAITVQSI